MLLRGVARLETTLELGLNLSLWVVFPVVLASGQSMLSAFQIHRLRLSPVSSGRIFSISMRYIRCLVRYLAFLATTAKLVASHWRKITSSFCCNVTSKYDLFTNPRIRRVMHKSSKLTSCVVMTFRFVAPGCRFPLHDIAINDILK